MRKGNAGTLGALTLAFAAMLASTTALAGSAPIGSVANAEGTLHVDVLSLKGSEADTVTLKLEIDNQSRVDFSMTLANIDMIDLAGRRSYRSGLYSTTCGAQAGKRVECWAMFGAPPPAVKTVAIKFYEHFDLITGIPVSE